MIATTTLETILVSATGDVLTCRSRDDADTFFPAERTNQSQTASTHGVMNLQPSSSKQFKESFCKDCQSWINGGSMQIDFCYVPDNARNKRTITFPSTQHKTSPLPGSFRSVSVPRMRGGLLGGSKDCDGNGYEVDWYNWGQHTGLRGGLLGGTAVASRATHINDYQNGGVSLGLAHASDNIPSRLLQSLVPSFNDHSEMDESLDSLSVGARRETVPGRSPTRKENKFVKALAYMKARGTNSKSETITTSHNTETIKSMRPFLMHGIPTFMSSLAQIAVTKVSAHPMGKHVLLISNDALLFSYGENDYGQLGQGTISGFVQTPTIVTSLLENGGKTVDCATGMNYSLVVVKTEGGRISRMRKASPLNMASRTFSYDMEDAPGTKVTNNPIWHHQLYGFGQNNYMQLGLENPFSLERTSSPISSPSTPKKSLNIENVWLPRRAALHCETWEQDDVYSNSLPPHGIFSIACGEYHSAALVHSSNGKVEVYTWGKVDDGALGLSSKVFQETQNIMLEAYQAFAEKSNLSVSNKSALQSVPIPTVVSSLTYDPILDQSASNSRSCPKSEFDYPMKVALGPTCTMVITSSGRCLSFGKSDDGLLGLGENICISTEPMELQFPILSTNGDDKSSKHSLQTKIKVSSVSIGARHAVAITKDNTAFSWGQSMNGRLGYVDSFSNELNAIPMKPDDEDEDPGSCVIWTPRQVIIPRQELNRSNVTKSTRKAPPKDNLPRIAKLQRNISMNNLRDDVESRHVHKDYTATACLTKDVNPYISAPVVHACAGYDNSIFVAQSGQVLSCGKQSGRLGRGEVFSDTPDIKPLFGGLHLWQER